MTVEEYRTQFKLDPGIPVAAVRQSIINKPNENPGTTYVVKCYDNDGGLDLSNAPPVPNGPIGENARDTWVTDTDGNPIAVPVGTHVTLPNSGTPPQEFTVTEEGIMPWGSDD